MITVKKIVDGNVWYVAEDTKKTKKSAFNIPIKFGFDKTEFKYRTVWNVFNEYKEMSIEDVPVNSVIEYNNKIYLVVTHCDEVTGWRTCYQLFHNRRKDVIYNWHFATKFAPYEEVILLTSTFERFCNLYEMYGKI